MRKYLAKIQRNFLDHGLLITVKKIFKQLLSPIFLRRIYRIYSIELSHLELPIEEISNFKFKRLNYNEDRIIQEIESLEEWLSGKVKDQLNNGNICIIALDGENLAGFNMIGFGKVYVPLIETYWHTESDAAWSEQITVKRAYRGKGLGKAIRNAAFKELRKIGIEWLYGGTLLDNVPSLKLSRSLGFKEQFDVHFYKIFGIKRWKKIEVYHGIK